MSINTRQQSLNISQVVSSPIGPTQRPVLRELQLQQPGSLGQTPGFDVMEI